MELINEKIKICNIIMMKYYFERLKIFMDPLKIFI